MQSKLRPVARCATQNVVSHLAARRASATWFLNAREALGLSQWAAAERLGKNQNSWWAWETGKHAAPADVVFIVMDWLSDAGIDPMRPELTVRKKAGGE
jgi:hypothetical protein